jgi:hypothetical protein
MKNNIMFVGTGGDVDIVEKKSLRYFLLAGIFAAFLFLMYECYKLSFMIASNITVYIDYPTDYSFVYVADYMLGTIVFLAILLMITGFAMFVASKISNAAAFKIVTISLVVILIISSILAILRVVADLTVLMSGCEDPAGAWIYRYYDGMILVAEWKVIPDILMNGILLFGLILIGTSAVYFFNSVETYHDVMKRGLKSDGESTIIDGNKYSLQCKELNGVKACKMI